MGPRPREQEMPGPAPPPIAGVPAAARASEEAPPSWPELDGRPVVFLLDASSGLEQRVLQEWIERYRPESANGAAYESIAVLASRRRRRGNLDRLEMRLATGDDPLLAPLRVAWLPAKRGDLRPIRLRDLLTTGDPRDPGRLRQEWILRREPDRCRVVVGDPAPASDLRERWRRAGGADAAQTTGLADFVTRQAALALERAERRLRGARYKVPRFVREEILSRTAFRGGIARLARELGRSEKDALRDASRYLAEIAATHSPYVIDLVSHGIRLLYTRGYGESLHYDRRQLQSIFALANRYPIVFLPSHKSNLDHLVQQYAIHENGHPPNHTAGGINMNFFPVGPVVRRSGVFFIRRSFKDNPVYKFVLRQYIDFLIEKRFSLEWYIEGGRSRSGKLLPPRFGMLAYVVDAFRRGKSEDVYLVPVSIAYDQIGDVGDYVAEQRGGAKRSESFGWFLGVVSKLRRRYGDIHLRFGEPLSMAGWLGQLERSSPGPALAKAASEAVEAGTDEQSLAVQKLAFEVAVRINRVTPLTPISLLALTMLGVGDRALTVDETVVALRDVVDYVRKRKLPTTVEIELDRPDAVRRTLEHLVENGVVTCFDEGPEAVYAIGPEQSLAAAYYRNTIIHFFVNGAIAELALLAAAEPDVVDRPGEFWNAAMRLRDLLKFEFFFAEKDEYRAELQDEVALHQADWQAEVAAGPEQIQALLRRFRPYSAHRVLRPFLEAYRVVGDLLVLGNPDEPIEPGVFLAKCLGLGKQYHLQRRIRSAESVSKVLFETALRLAANRQLLAPAPDLAARRQAFADEIRDNIRRVATIGAMAWTRFAGVIH